MRIPLAKCLVVAAIFLLACYSVRDVASPAPTIVRVEIVGLGHNHAGAVGHVTYQLTLSGFDIGGTPVPVLSPVQWSSTDSSVAHVTAHGLLTAVGRGDAYVRSTTQIGSRLFADSIHLTLADSFRLVGPP